MKKLYVIECRDSKGDLKFDCPQPESFFGARAITGIDYVTMATMIYSEVPNCVLSGDDIPSWPKLINPHWVARQKTW